jgi:hypothetical protein
MEHDTTPLLSREETYIGTLHEIVLRMTFPKEEKQE